jgi:hypothetical protein
MSEESTVWYYKKWDVLLIRWCELMWFTDDGVTISFYTKHIKKWDNFIYLGNL